MRGIGFSLILFASLAAAQLPITNGGTGANNATTARSNLSTAGVSACSANQYATGTGASSTPCAQVDYSQLTGTPTIPAAIPSGAIMFIKTGSCPSGWTQESGFIGLYILATTAAAGDVGTTGGSTSYTPAGSSAAPTVSSLTAAAQGFTGALTTVPAETVNSLTAAAQTVNSLTAAAQGFSGEITTVPAETVNSLTAAAQTVNSLTAAAQAISGAPAKGTLANSATATSGNCAATNIAAGTGTATACKATAPNLTVPAETISGAPTAGTLANASSAVTGTMNTSAVTGTLNSTTITPLGHNATSAVTGTLNSSAVTGTLNSTTITPLGNNAPSAVTGTLNAGAFSGTLATIQPPYVKLIPCSKN